MKTCQKSRGFALSGIIIMVFTLTTMIGTLVLYVSAEQTETNSIINDMQARLYAEAGIDEAIYYLTNVDLNWAGDSSVFHPVSIPGSRSGGYVITISNPGTGDPRTVTITSTGYIPDASNPIATKTITASGSAATAGSSPAIHEVYNYALYTGWTTAPHMTFDGSYNSGTQANTLDAYNNQIKGDFHLRGQGNFNNSNNRVSNGTANTESIFVKSGWNGNIAQTENQVAAAVTITDLSTETAWFNSNAEVTYPGGTNLSGSTIDLGADLVADGDIYVGGDLEISASSVTMSGSGYLFVTGDITISADSVLKSGNGVANIIALGDIIITGNANKKLQGAYYVGGTLTITTPSNRTIDFDKSSVVVMGGISAPGGQKVQFQNHTHLSDVTRNPNAYGRTGTVSSSSGWAWSAGGYGESN
jgi:hypothetical protein